MPARESESSLERKKGFLFRYSFRRTMRAIFNLNKQIGFGMFLKGGRKEKLADWCWNNVFWSWSLDWTFENTFLIKSKWSIWQLASDIWRYLIVYIRWTALIQEASKVTFFKLYLYQLASETRALKKIFFLKYFFHPKSKDKFVASQTTRIFRVRTQIITHKLASRLRLPMLSQDKFV